MTDAQKEPTEQQIARAAFKWRDTKKGETGNSEIEYFKQNWKALAGLKDFVDAEVAADAQTELLPCPFCGGAEIEQSYCEVYGEWNTWCHSCRSTASHADSETSAILWNTRPAQEAIKQRDDLAAEFIVFMAAVGSWSKTVAAGLQALEAGKGIDKPAIDAGLVEYHKALKRAAEAISGSRQ